MQPKFFTRLFDADCGFGVVFQINCINFGIKAYQGHKLSIGTLPGQLGMDLNRMGLWADQGWVKTTPYLHQNSKDGSRCFWLLSQYKSKK